MNPGLRLLDPRRILSERRRVPRGRLGLVLGWLLVCVFITPAFAVPETQMWVERYDGSGSGYDYATAIGVSPDGSKVYVTGFGIGSGTGYDYATLAYQAGTGERLWVSRYNGPADGYDDAHDLAVSPDGSQVYVTGSSQSSSVNDDFFTVDYDASTGTRLWMRRYDGPARTTDDAQAVGVSPDGSQVYVTGTSKGLGSDFDYSTVAYDAATGKRLWVERYDGPRSSWDQVHSLGVSPDGSSVYVTGTSRGEGTFRDYATVAYDADTGERVWVKRYDGPASYRDEARALGVSPDGSEIYVTGYSGASKSTYDYVTVAYGASTGTRLWQKRYDGPAGVNDYAEALGVDPGGSDVYVTGFSYASGTGSDYATVAYDAATGKRMWAKRYDGPAGSGDGAWALAVSPDGLKVYVTGESGGKGSRLDYATVAWRAATGKRLWVKRYDGPAGADDYGQALAVGPDGSAVYVTGASRGSGTLTDYATVGYRAA